MSNLKAEITLDWGDATRLFRLTVNGLLELEEKCGAAFTVIHHRLATNAYSSADLRETIRLGLVGGGMDPSQALKLVRRYVDGRPRAESWGVALAVLGATLFGFGEAPLGKEEAAPSEESPSVSTPPQSTETPPSSAVSPSQTSTASRFGSGQPL